MAVIQRRLASILICCLLVGAGFLPWAAAAIRSTPTSEHTWPRLSSLDGGVAGFLQRRGSALANVTVGDQSAAQIIENMTAYYNVESRIILALLETTTGAISAQTVPVSVTDQPFGVGTPGFSEQIEWAAREIRVGFGPYDVAPSVMFSDGTRRTLDLADDPHALTVKRFLAHGRTFTEWEQLVARYPVVYTQLFQNEPAVAPPTPAASSGFLSIPWVAGTNVIHSSYFDHTYPMVDSGGDGNTTMTDYLGRASLSYNSHDGHDYYFPDQPFGTPIVAAAAGWAFPRTTRGLGVLIQHTGAAAGYESVYWHLMDFAPDLDDFIDSSKPRWVERGDLLGWSGATGFTDGAPHLHFEIRHNGNQVDPYGWYGPGADPCIEYVKCEASVWLWNDSVPWNAPDATTPRTDTTPPTGLLTINPPSDVRLLAQFDGTPLSAIGPSPASDGVSFGDGKWKNAVQVGVGDSLTYPTSPTLDLDRGTLAMWVNVPDQWPESRTERHYLLAASANPADPARIYSGTLALRHEQRNGAPSWNFWTVTNDGSAHELSIPDTLAAGWHHFVIAWDRAAGQKTLAIDGERVASATNVALPESIGSNLELGRWTIGAGESNALFDDVTSYDHVLAPKAVRDLAQATTAQNGSTIRTENRDLSILTPATDNGGGVVTAQLGINGVYAAPLPYYSAYRWTLPAAEGAYTVSVRLADRVGNTTTLTRSISIDHAPQGSITLRAGTPLSTTLVISATDKDVPLQMALSADPHPFAKSWEPLVRERTWYWLPINPRRVYVWFRDANGNERGPFVAGIDLWRAYLPRIER